MCKLALLLLTIVACGAAPQLEALEATSSTRTITVTTSPNWQIVSADIDKLDINTQGFDRFALLANAGETASTKSPAISRMRTEVSLLLKDPTAGKLHIAEALLSLLESHGQDVITLKKEVKTATRALPRSDIEYAPEARGAPYTGTASDIQRALAALPDNAIAERMKLIRTLTQLPRSDASLVVINNELNRNRGFTTPEQQLEFVLNTAGVWSAVEPERSAIQPARNLGAMLNQKFDWELDAHRGGLSARTGCVSNTKCHWAVPLYDQNDTRFGATWLVNEHGTESMLCGPASAAMALHANLAAAPPDSVSTWVSDFQGQGMIDRVLGFADLLVTDPEKGTPRSRSIANYILLNQGLYYGNQTPSSFQVETDWNTNTPTSLFRQKLQTTPAIVVHYGKYQKFTKIVAGDKYIGKFIEYRRVGGHIIVIRGHDGDLLEINDPWDPESRWDHLEARNAVNITTWVNGIKTQTFEVPPHDNLQEFYIAGARSDDGSWDFAFIDVTGGIENANH